MRYGEHSPCPYDWCLPHRHFHIHCVSRLEAGLDLMLNWTPPEKRLYGATSVQTYSYFHKFGRTDRWGLKSLARIPSSYHLWLITHHTLDHSYLVCRRVYVNAAFVPNFSSIGCWKLHMQSLSVPRYTGKLSWSLTIPPCLWNLKCKAKPILTWSRTLRF